MLVLDKDSFEAKIFDHEERVFDRAGSPEIIDSIHALSKEILGSRLARQYPDLITFGYFCRKSSIVKQLESISDLESRFGLGTIVHIAPSNIAMNFAFSFIMALVAGNKNLVRLPSFPFPQADLALEMITSCFDHDHFPAVVSDTVFFRSERDSAKLSEIVLNADGLVTWGGDATVRHFRTLDRKPLSREISFPSRQSSSVLDSRAFLALDKGGRQVLLQKFFNDSYLVDQNACSSPSIVFWFGKLADGERASNLFWSELEQYVDKTWETRGQAGIEKLNDLFNFLEKIKSPLEINFYSNTTWVTRDRAVLSNNLRYGFFYEAIGEDLSSFFDLVRPTEQTITYFSLNPIEIRDVALRSAAKQIDRICPIGQALDIGLVWDGKDTLPLMSRKVSIT